MGHAEPLKSNKWKQQSKLYLFNVSNIGIVIYKVPPPPSSIMDRIFLAHNRWIELIKKLILVRNETDYYITCKTYHFPSTC